MRSQQIEGFRLSPQQKHLWLLQQEQAMPYRVQSAILITERSSPQLTLRRGARGNLNLDFLKTAIQQVIHKYEILRTTFHCLPGMTIPLQVIADKYQISVNVQDLSELSLTAQENKINLIFEDLKQLKFDIQARPPLHISLVTLSPDKCILLISLSALIADTITLKLLVNEIKNFYQTLDKESQSDAPMQYADIAEWQNELLETAESEVGKEYWQNQNISSIPMQLWFEKQEAKKLEFQPDSISLNIPDDLTKKIETIGQIYDIDYPNILLTCWTILLGKLAGQSDLVVNIPSDGRKYEELELALGLLAKYLPLSCHLAPSLTFIQLLKQVRELVKNSYEWQEYYTWEETRESGDRSLSASSAPVCFEFDEWQEIAAPEGISFSMYRQYSCIDRFKLKLACQRKKDALVAEFHFDSSLYNLDNIQDLSTQFQTLLTSAVDRPAAPINQLNILNARDRQQILFEFNHTTVDYPHDRCIHQLIEAQAARTPHNIAVVFEGQQLTYAQLNTRANRLAHYLQQLGVGTEVVVALYVERSLELVIGMLAILKAGGAYLPLDPTLPKSGLAFRLQDVQPLVLLTQQQLVEQLPECSAQTICLDAEWETIATASQENPRSQVRTENLAYVLFTSGSTGKPKGVAVEHRHLANYIYAVRDRLDLAECNSFATVSTFAADLGNTAIFPALCSGGCLHVISPERASNPEALADYFHRHPIDCLKIVPSHLAALLTAAQPERILPKLRLVLGGEACSWQAIAQIQKYAPNCRIFNHYGPTETTVGVLAYPLQPGEKPETQTAPIGRPLANTQVYLLDSELQPVPIGVSGELYIGGAGVARGYFNRPELTSEKFIPHPFGGTGRLYKTGDLARYLPDGNIEFIGRSDRQVKIHGFRIEPGEIETALRQHPAVRETVVLGREDRGNQRLVAYVVPEQNCDLTTSELRDFLLDLLPESIVPSVFVRLKALPLSPNGKIDFQALPAPEPSQLETGTFVAPRIATEQVLAEIWAKILELPQVGIHDNFFELGGDSIQSIRIVAKANQAGLQLTPKQMFEYQTIAELAAVAGITQIEIPRSPANPDPSPAAKSNTPADFPGANLDRKDLDQLLAQINRKSNQKHR